MNKIDIVTTSTIRPEILDKTYKSFCRNLFKNTDNYRLIINIDPIGDKNKSVKDVLNVAKKYFSDVVFNFPSEPGFTKSVMWLWSHTISDYVFHLEDDWILNKNINIDEMISILDKYPSICTVRLSKGSIGAGGKALKSFNCKFAVNEDCKKFKLFPRISLNPTLFRGSFVREAVKVMTTDINPESQLVYNWAVQKRNFKSNRINEFLEGWEYSVYTGCGEKSVVKDIGRQWRDKMRIKRQYDFVQWG